MIYSKGAVIITDPDEANNLYQDGYGSHLRQGFNTLDFCETLFLVENERVSVLDENLGTTLSFHELLSNFLPIDPLIWTRFIVYRDIRGRGFVIKCSRDNQVSFTVYERGSYLKKTPAYDLYAIYEGRAETLGYFENILFNSRESGRSIKLAVIDRRGEIVYYSLDEFDFKNLFP